MKLSPRELTQKLKSVPPFTVFKFVLEKNGTEIPLDVDSVRVNCPFDGKIRGYHVTLVLNSPNDNSHA